MPYDNQVPFRKSGCRERYSENSFPQGKTFTKLSAEHSNSHFKLANLLLCIIHIAECSKLDSLPPSSLFKTFLPDPI